MSHYLDGGTARKWYIAAATCAMAIVPYTIATMGQVNGELIAKSASTATRMLNDTTVSLLNRWSLLSSGRAILLFASSLCTIMAGVMDTCQ